MDLKNLEILSPEEVKKLQGKGIFTVERLAICSAEELAEMLGAEEGRIEEILIEAWKKTGHWFIRASDYSRQAGEIVLTTGSKALDDLLGGGVRTKRITEFIGEYRVGKTQTALTILVETLGREPDAHAVYMDSEKGFNDGRIMEIAKNRGYDGADILQRISLVPVVSCYHMIKSLQWIDGVLSKRKGRILVVDSVIAPFRSEYIGRETLAERQQLLGKALDQMSKIAEAYNIAVVATNQVVARPEQTYSYDPLAEVTPAGGHILGHRSQERIHLRKGRGDIRIARLIDSSWLPPGECMFRITDKGVEDIPEKKTAAKKAAAN